MLQACYNCVTCMLQFTLFSSSVFTDAREYSIIYTYLK